MPLWGFFQVSLLGIRYIKNKKNWQKLKKSLFWSTCLNPFLYFQNQKPWHGTQFITSLNVQEKTKLKSDFKNLGQFYFKVPINLACDINTENDVVFIPFLTHLVIWPKKEEEQEELILNVIINCIVMSWQNLWKCQPNSKKLMSISTTKWSGRWSLKKFIWLVGGEWHSELRLEKLGQKMNLGSHFCCEDVLMQKNCTNNSVPFQRHIFPTPTFERCNH